jgi:hypothetical protein
VTVEAKEYRGSRLSIALAVLEEGRTLYEIAKLQGKSSGAVHGVVHRMVADALLEADSDPPTRGTLYQVPEVARETVLAAAEGSQAPGSLGQHQRLLTLRGGPGRVRAMELLGSSALAGAVRWVARINSADELLVAMNPEAEDELVDSLVVALVNDGFECREGLVAQIMSGRELREHSRKVLARAKGLA